MWHLRVGLNLDVWHVVDKEGARQHCRGRHNGQHEQEAHCIWLYEGDIDGREK